MKTSKRILAALLALMLVLSLAACAKTPASSTAPTESKDSTSQEEKSYYNKEGLPICNDVITITVSGVNNGHNEWDKTVFVKEVRERLGIQWDSTPYEKDAWDSQFALMLSNDRLPDLLVSASVNKTQLDQYGKEGFILNLNDYMDLMPNVKAMDTEMPAYLKYFRSPDGSLYGLGSGTTSLVSRALVGYSWLPKKWLKNVGMEVPNTVEELYQVLKAFKEKDANGNGDPNDEIPMSMTFGVQCAQRAEWGMKFAFGLYSIESDYQLFVDNDKVNIYETTDNYRKYLTFLNKLWSEGLMDAETFTQSSAEYRDKVASDRIGYGGDWAGLEYSLGKSTADNVWNDYDMIMTFESEVDKGRFFALGDGLNAGTNYFVSAKTKYPEAIARMTDYWFTDEGKLLLKFGVEGESFDYEPEDEFGVKDITTANYDKTLGYLVNVLWTNIAFGKEAAVVSADKATLEKMKANPRYFEYASEVSFLNDATIVDAYPTVSFTAEEGKERVSLSTDIKLYIQQMHTSFINGQVELTDKNWNDFQAKMNEMGLSRLLEIEQAAYDRLMKNS